MYKISALLVFFGLSLNAFAQTPFTITQANFPVLSYQYFNGGNNFNGVGLSPAANGNWDLSSYHGATTSTNPYEVEVDPFYTSAGIDVYISDVKSMTSTLGYATYNELDFNSNGVFDRGIYIDAQAYSLGSFTGNANDSLIVPFQGYVYPVGRQVMKFPATYQSSWSSEHRRVVDFNLTVTALGLNKTPFEHAYTIFRTDTIIGWGKMRVYSGGGSSIPYDVLIDRSIQYAVDSFYTGGAPAPTALLTAFGITQGQHTNVSNRYTVYRPGRSTPLAVLLYGNTTFTNPTKVFVDTEELQTSGVETLEQNGYATILYPNPSSTGSLTLQITGNAPEISSYIISDLQGRTVQSGSVELQGQLIEIQMNAGLPNGNYMLQVLDDKKQTQITEQVMLQK